MEKRTRHASEELQSWYEAALRPRLVRAAQLGIADPKRLAALDRDLWALIGEVAEPSAVDRPPAKAA